MERTAGSEIADARALQPITVAKSTLDSRERNIFFGGMTGGGGREDPDDLGDDLT